MKTTKITAKRSEALFPAWKRGMNPEQLEAIEHTDGPLRLLAAAGSGKTSTVCNRVARLITAGVDPARILAVTFSKKAADEMSERIKRLGIDGARVGTFHALCLEIIKKDHTHWSTWEIDSKNRAKVLLKEITGYRGLDWKGVDHGVLTTFIGQCKANLYEPDSPEALKFAQTLFRFNATKAVIAFARFNEGLAERGMLTFDDMIVFVCRYLADDEAARTTWAGKWDYVIQDEAQDANNAQRTLMRFLARDHGNYMVVGDVFQAIYKFRGSSPEYLAQFDQEWPGAKTIWLGRNYRSASAIIDAANNIVKNAHVEGYEPRMMVGERKEAGSVTAIASENLDEEGRAFVDWTKNILDRGGRPASITALFRTNAQSRAFEESLLKAKIPYVVVGGVSFYERKEVRDLLAYLRVGAERGEGEDIQRCINAPFRFLGKAFTDRVMRAAGKASGIDWASLVLDVSQEAGIQERQRASAGEWAGLVQDVASRVQAGIKPDANVTEKRDARPAEILNMLIHKTRYLDWLTKEEGEESVENSAAANVREMARMAERFNSVYELLTYINETIRSARIQREDGQAGGDRVLLMSIHKSKGLEWPHVWVAGMNEMILPHMRGDLEEERRLAYVAVTRARDTLVLSYVRSIATRAGVKDAEPSRFLLDADIGEDLPPSSLVGVGEACDV